MAKAKLIKGKDPTTGKMVAHDAKWWGRANAHYASTQAARGNPKYSPLYKVTSILGGTDLANAANALTDAQVKPQVAAYNTGISEAKGHGAAVSGRVSDYYKRIAQEEAGNVATRAAIAQGAQGQQQAIGQQGQDRINAAGADESARGAADAKLRGQGLSGGADQQLAATLAQAKANSAQSAQTGATDINAQGTASALYGSKLGSATQAHGTEAIGNVAAAEDKTVNDLTSKRAGVEASRGDLYTKALMQLRSGEFDKYAALAGLANAATSNDIKRQLGFAQITAGNERVATQQAGANQRNAATNRTSSANNQRTTATTRRGQDITRRGQDLSHSDRQAALIQRARGGGGGGRPKTKDFTKEVNAAWGDASKLRKAGYSASQVTAILSGQRPTNKKAAAKIKALGIGRHNPLFANAGADLVFGGYFTDGTARQLWDLHYDIPGAWRPRSTTSRPVAVH